MRLSVSKIKSFKSCRRMYELRYIERLRPVQTAEALEIGKSYHKLLEALNNGTTFANNPEYADDRSKEMAMARAYERYIYPRFVVSEAEKWIEKDLGGGNILVGQVDGIAGDGHIVEHKSYGGNDTMEQYEYNLLWDEQILAYMFLTGKRKVWYTICRKPNIRLKKGETEEEFFYRMLDWYETDTDEKIKLLEIERTDAEVEQFEEELMLMVNEMINTKHFYRNTCQCNMYGRRCEYSSVCLHYDPNQQYLEFVKEDEYEPEKNRNNESAVYSNVLL